MTRPDDHADGTDPAGRAGAPGSGPIEGSERGVAMIMAIVAVTMLGVIVYDFARNSQVHAASTMNVRDEVRAEYLARSSINLSRLLLSVQGVVTNEMRRFHLRPPPLWQFADYFVLSFDDPTSLELMGSLVGVGMEGAEGFGSVDGEMQVTIVDEESKINLNLATQGPVMQQVLGKELLALFLPADYNHMFEDQDSEGDFEDRDDVAAALIDWADSDTNAFGTEGGEDGSYEMGEDPYPRKNAAYDSLEEIMLVKGVDDDFWAAFLDPEPEHPEARAITIWGSGKINPNTADPLVLMSVICAFATDPGVSCDPNNMDQMGQLLRYLMDIKSLMGVPFSNPGKFVRNIGTGAEGIPGVDMNGAEAGNYLTVDSEVFSIYAMGTVGRSRKRLHVVLDMRGPNAMKGGKVLYWRDN